MPTTYAHDLFGKEVYKRLPPDMKALLRRHGDLYRIGLHGPDILFYYMVSKNPVTQFGIEMHPFFKKGSCLLMMHLNPELGDRIL